MALLGSMCQESAAITADQVAGASAIAVATAGAFSAYALYRGASRLSQETKIQADCLRKELWNRFGTYITYQGNVVDITTLTDDQLFVITGNGSEKILSDLLVIASRAYMILCGVGSACFAVKAIESFNK